LAYNKVEEKIDDLFAVAIGLSGPLLAGLRSRIGGIVLGLLKGYRNAAVHAILINVSIGIGLS
jgi:hypothetical protein